MNNRLYVALVLLALIGATRAVNAADCRVNGGAWQPVDTGGGVDFAVPVTVRLGSDTTRILLEGVRLECRFTPHGGTPNGQQDYWKTGSRVGEPWSPGPKISHLGTGLRINGAFRNAPVAAGIDIATMPNTGAAIGVDVTPYVLLRNNPVSPVDIKAGDVLGLLRLDQTNNYDSTATSLVLRYTATNDFTISPSTCTINNNNPIVIDFGNVHQRAIGTDPLTSTVRSDRRLTYNCSGPGLSLPITITYQGTASSFNPNLLRMTNADMGAALVRGGAAVRVNGSFQTRITNSVGQDDVTFSLVRRAGTLPDAGPISGSGVLVMGVP
jgi:minor fimbrial subunit